MSDGLNVIKSYSGTIDPSYFPFVQKRIYRLLHMKVISKDQILTSSSPAILDLHGDHI